MKLKPTFIKNYQITISYLFILLFVYAAVSKILDFENFQVQLGQSPLLSAFASWVSWLVLVLELGIVVLLMFSKFRIIGLAASLSLMTLFTAYIFIILHYSSFIPCSCGGILEKMSWNTHLFFNISLILLATISLYFQNQVEIKNKKTSPIFKSIIRIVIPMLLSVIVMIGLFVWSEKIIYYENPFIRRYPQHPVIRTNTIDLKYNSYYIAGYENGSIYLGNYSNPLHIVSMDTKLRNRKHIKISFDPKKIPFEMVTIKVKANYFYLMDGSVPAVFRGNTANWKITTEFKSIPHFSRAEAIDSTSFIFRSYKEKKIEHILGVYSSEIHPKIKYNQALLQKQIDGVFDTDGKLLFSEKLKKAVYLYYYRNEFIIANKNAKLLYRGHTIDTNTHAKIKISTLKNGTERKMSAPPFIVNAQAAIENHLLFVNSKVKGKYENDRLWEQAFIIDVYDLNKKKYLLSFALYKIGDGDLNSLLATPKQLYAIIGNTLVVCELGSILRKEINSLK